MVQVSNRTEEQMTDQQQITKIKIEREGKWHLQIYTLDELGYDHEEQLSEYCDTLEECYKVIDNFTLEEDT
jgi:hypothetical protein